MMARKYRDGGGGVLGLWILVFSVFLTVGDTYNYQQQVYGTGDDNSHGLFPNVFNLAATSVITVNATCGEFAPEVYCKLVEHVDFRERDDHRRNRDRQDHCSVCDAKSSDKSHPIDNAIDGTNRWWQSPTLQNGKQYEWVTITLDLKQVYQIAYVIVKAAVSPRPGNWILERSLDGILYLPWQYYALTDSECWKAYGIVPTRGKPNYRKDDDVICTSYYSKLNPLENGEIHTSLLNGRPGVDGPSSDLMDFTKARYVRLRLQKIRTLNADLMSISSSDPENIDKLVTRRYFYSIKDISVGGQCACSGHASTCIADPETGNLRCECKHNTCGDNCDHCCPLYNQRQWNHGTSESAEVCEKCECYGHADKCHYDQNVADKKLSINTLGKYQGGGVCADCKHHTTGINCEKCEDGYFRPSNVPRNHSRPCRKCQCDGPGMTGLCVKDDSHLLEGLEPGDCFCKSGFAGKNCDTCDIGYRNYPLCTPCPCHTAGTIGGSICEGECICKTHVEGSRCDRCKAGFYHLSADNSDGCSQCFCFGMTDECTEADWGVNIVQNIEDWRVTDLAGTRIVKPLPENGNVVIANDDVSMFSSYYWLAPPDYLGKKLYSYGSDLKFTLSYVVARGDTSGTYTENADVVLEGNGQQIGYNWGVRAEDEEVAISVPLREQGWFLLTPREDGSKSVSREDFTLILNNLTKLLIRAKFHTDQIEGRLHNIGMEIAAEDSKSLRRLGSVEKCACPVGYAGLSCELCAPGYRSKSSGPKISHVCERCDCYNHAESCDNPAGRCENCMHHTTGLKCDRCKRGYYGNATIGTPDDCKPCACPLENPENNFSPSCTAIQTATGDSDYICDQCPEGYDGNKCERCYDGYFGNPQIVGGYCQKCDCSGNADTSAPGWCDSLTGQCLKCLYNTAGWNCGECKPEHYGNAELRNCQPCSCNPHGSLSPQCDMTTGQCLCKPGVVGRTCNRCADGYGNLEAGCEPCKCNPTGSHSEICDPVTGYCSCKPGVFGITCDSCLDGYFGFSRQGCQECRCDRLGSLSVQCDENTGQCSCKPHVIGRSCDRCEDGYWNLQSGNGCEKCHCNRTGSLASVCDKGTGQCNCKPGVGGQFCDQCLPGYFMFTNQGCRRCDPCDKPGHICDPTNGRCVCPPHTTGSRCQKCERNAWGYDPVKGCKPCNCNRQGSHQQSCDPDTGNCICLEGFEGRLCDQCRHGFYSFPNCHKCDCNFDGTVSSQCRDTVCQCNTRGDCPCKELVTGQKCDRCVDGAFGLSAEAVRGCHNCFCFGKTRVCDQASMYWTKMQFPSRDVLMEIGTSDIQSRVGFQIFPEEESANRLGIPYVLDKPLYWSLPKDRLGDKVLSYNGYLTFNIEVRGSSHFPDRLLERYPLVVLQGNQRIILVHTQPKVPVHTSYQVHLHEDAWKMHDNPLIPVTKTVLMVALQNLQYLLIRGTDGPEVKYARLYNATIDVASSGYTQSLAKGVEMCRCPREYIGTSCQDPAPGYYRKRKPNYLNSKDVLDFVGWAEPCACNNHTNICDKETGVCINCGGNTMGDHCDQCIKGYYGDPSRGPCRPCACPHPSNSFSDTCVPDALDYICINCQQGYTGRHCERCDVGYYGDPSTIDGKCTPCNCNPYGSKRRDCDPRTGQCECNDGVSGRDCTVCSPGFILTEYGCKSCDDECTGILLKELFEMKLQIDDLNVLDLPRLPWGYLNRISAEEQRLRPLVDDYQKNISMGKELIDQFTSYLDLETKADLLLIKADDYIKRAKTVSGDAKDTLGEAEQLLLDINEIFRKLKELVAELEAGASDPTSPHISVERMLIEAEKLLREIKARDFDPDKDNAERELRKAQNLLNSIKKLTVADTQVDGLKERLGVLQKLLDDLLKRIDENVRKPVARTLETYQIGLARKENVLAMINEINGHLETSNMTLKEADDLLNLANNALIDASIKFEYLPRFLRELGNATDRLDELRSKLAYLNPIYKEKYVIPAQRHAEELEKQSQRLANLFKPTKELSNIPLKAAKAYQNIIDAILAAELAAQEAERAAENADRQAYPPVGDSLSKKAEDARAKSLKLLAEAQKLNEEKVPELEGKMRERRKDLDDLSEDLAFGKRNNDLINKELDALPKGVQGVVEDAAEKARLAEGKAKRANNKVDRLLNRLDNDLIPKFESIQANTVGGLENLTRMIEKARDDTRTASRLADSADASAKRVRKQHEITMLNLKELKDKILLARQKASSIKIGLTADYNGKCVRSYAPAIEPSTTNNIILNFATKSNKRDSLLFFVGSKKEVDFMAIEMVNRRIRFLWNVGGDTQIITHDKEIETNSEQFLKNSQWFKIEANRIGNIGTLSVKRTPDGQKTDPYEVTGSSTAGFTKMDLDASSAFFIGGFPTNFEGPRELQTSSFSGCLYEAILDGKPVGLWNFLTNEGCDACKEGATEDIDVNAFEFQGGDSYAILSQIPYYKKSDIYAVLSFRTLNEDALLFFSANNFRGHMMSLELKGGKVVFQIKMDNKVHIRLESKNKYNTGQWIRVEVAREKFEAQMQVENEFLDENIVRSSSSALELRESAMYYGGVPPNFTMERWPEVTFNTFFGCMKDLQIDSTPIDLNKGSYYGMIVGCSNRPLKVASFKGTGYLEMKGQPILGDSSISFSFMTNQNDALLLISTFSGQDVTDPELLQSYYSVSLKDGRIVTMFSSGGNLQMASNRFISHGVFHTINIIKKNKKLLLRLDDDEENEIRLPKGAKGIPSPQNGGLFFGGVRRNVNIGNMAASQQPFIGIIQDAIFNDRLLRFENTVSHKNVGFGRPNFNKITEAQFQQMAPSSPAESCSPDLHVDDDAVSLQNSKSVEVALNKKEVVNSFNISVDYRTFYPEGKIISLMNKQKKLKLSLYLDKGLVKADFLKKKHKKNGSSLKESAIGKWHKVDLIKKGKQLLIFVDRKESIALNIPKRLPFNRLLLGGIQNEIQSTFKGCFRNLHVNDRKMKIPSEYPCFKHVEFGAYFTGLGYIMQDSGVHINNKLDLSVQFRTTRFDGTMIGIYSTFTGVGIELCLSDNTVIATLFEEGDLKLQLNEPINTDRICDYKWHTIELSFKHSNFVLSVDDSKPVVTHIKNRVKDINFAEVYIGGKPDKYQSMGKCKHNFSGCIKTITLNGDGLQIKNSESKDNIVQFNCPQL